MNNIRKRYKEATRAGKIAIILISFLVVMFVIGLCVYSVGTIIQAFPGHDASKSPFYYAFSTKAGRVSSLLFSLAVLLLLLILLFHKNKKNFVTKDDEKGVHYMDQKTHGSAEWMDKETAKEIFTVANIKDTNEVVYGQYTENGEEVVAYKKPRGAELNRNIMIMAPSGSGKSFTQVQTHLIQHIKAGHSCGVTDPDGSVYGNTCIFARNRGAKTHVINFAEPEYSECINIVKECLHPDTERLDGLRLNMFVETFVSNTGDGIKDYYFDAAANLIKAVIGYTSYWNEQYILAGYKRLYLKITGKKEDPSDPFFKRVNNSLVSFRWCREHIMKIALAKGYREEDVLKCFEKIRKYADQARPFNIGEVYENIINFDKVEKFMDQGECPIEKWHPATTNYIVYHAAKPEARNAAIQGAQLRFGLFIDPNIRYILSHDGLDLKRFNMEQTVLYVITQDKSEETDPIASILFTFLFKDIQDVYDKQKRISMGTGKPNPCLGSAILLDDFFSLGVIGGKPKMFAKTMADARKREVYITIVLQQYSQLRALYGDDFKASIQGNCATLIYLGGNDPETADFIADFMGIATALDETHGVNNGLFSIGMSEPGYRSSSTARDLVTRGEAVTWKESVMVKFQNEQPLQIKPFPWIELPEYKNGECIQTSFYNEIPSIAELEYFDGPSEGEIENELQKDMNKAISELKNYDVDEKTGEVRYRNAQNTEQSSASNQSSNNDPDQTERVEDLFDYEERADKSALKELNIRFSDIEKE